MGFEFCDELVESITTNSTDDDSSFKIHEETLDAGHNLCAVAITLDDDPNDSKGVDSGRASALIDYIHIRNGSAIGWAESFGGGNP